MNAPTVEVTGARPDLYDPPPVRRAFSPGDALRLVIGIALLAVGLVLATAATNTISGAETDVVETFSRLPDRVEEAVIGVAQLVATLFPLLALVVVLWRRRWRLLLGLWLAGNVASLATYLVERALGDRDSIDFLTERTVSSAWLVDPDFPSTTYLAAAAAWVAVGSPWLSRRWRRSAWAWVTLLVLLRVVGSGEPVLDVVLSVAIGVVVGSIVLLVLGSPNPEPSPEELYDSLVDVGFEPTALERMPPHTGVLRFRMREGIDSTRLVKLRTPHDRSSDLLNRLYRAVRLRSSEVERPFSTLKRHVEHEALLLKSARDAGARCPDVLTVGTTPSGSVYLVVEDLPGPPVSTLDADQLTPEVLREIYRQLEALHENRIAHRSLSLDNISYDRETRQVWLDAMDDAELAASKRDQAKDIAEALVDLSLVIGSEASVTPAVEVLGNDEVASSLPLLQPLALPKAVRKRVKADKSILDRLQAEIQSQTGAADIELEPIERLPRRTVVMIVAAAMAFYALLPQFANIDQTVDAFGDARLEWLPAIVLAAAATFVFATISFMGSVAQPLPVAASARVTMATAFASLVGPGTAGRMALTVRFLQRGGISTSDASASVALNAIAGLVTHLLLLVSFLAWTGSADVGGFSLPDSNTFFLIMAAVVAVAAIASLLGPVRRRVIRPAMEALRTAASYVTIVMRSPARVLALLGGSSLITLSYMAALVFSVEAFGGGLSVPQIGAAYLAAAAIANFAPTPGGLGALEAALIAALTGFGLSDAAAVSSVLTFRLATYWLPILPGWLSVLWMQRNDEL